MVAGRSAFREAYLKAGPVILEPMMKVQLTVPDEFQGSVLGDINRRRGMVMGSEVNPIDQSAVVDAEVPLASMFGYSTEIRSATKGQGEFTMEFARYTKMMKSEQDRMIKEAAVEKKS